MPAPVAGEPITVTKTVYRDLDPTFLKAIEPPAPDPFTEGQLYDAWKHDHSWLLQCGSQLNGISRAYDVK